MCKNPADGASIGGMVQRLVQGEVRKKLLVTRLYSPCAPLKAG